MAATGRGRVLPGWGRGLCPRAASGTALRAGAVAAAGAGAGAPPKSPNRFELICTNWSMLEASGRSWASAVPTPSRPPVRATTAVVVDNFLRVLVERVLVEVTMAITLPSDFRRTRDSRKLQRNSTFALTRFIASPYALALCKNQKPAAQRWAAGGLSGVDQFGAVFENSMALPWAARAIVSLSKRYTDGFERRMDVSSSALFMLVGSHRRCV